jgi:antitoxin component YwqK of YwqJK toxin-antitoxin module
MSSTDDKPPREGEHRIHFSDGSLSGLEHYVDGQKSGSAAHWYRNSRKKAEGQYLAGLFTGEWTWWRENGELLQQGGFVDGEQHGRWRRWHPNGQLMDEGDWVHGKRSGEWVHYDRDGVVTKTQRHPDRAAGEEGNRT